MIHTSVLRGGQTAADLRNLDEDLPIVLQGPALRENPV